MKGFALALIGAVVFCALCALSEWAGARLEAKGPPHEPVPARKPADVSALKPESGLCVDGTVTRTIDGDTLEFQPDPITTLVRLDDCWAEESRGEIKKRTPAGAKAAENLKAIAEKKRGRLFIPGSKRLSDMLTLGRVVGRVWVDGQQEDLSTIQVKAGHAKREKTKAGVGSQESGVRLDVRCGLLCACECAKAEPDGLEILGRIHAGNCGCQVWE